MNRPTRRSSGITPVSSEELAIIELGSVFLFYIIIGFVSGLFVGINLCANFFHALIFAFLVTGMVYYLLPSFSIMMYNFPIDARFLDFDVLVFMTDLTLIYHSSVKYIIKRRLFSRSFVFWPWKSEGMFILAYSILKQSMDNENSEEHDETT